MLIESATPDALIVIGDSFSRTHFSSAPETHSPLKSPKLLNIFVPRCEFMHLEEVRSIARERSASVGRENVNVHQRV